MYHFECSVIFSVSQFECVGPETSKSIMGVRGGVIHLIANSLILNLKTGFDKYSGDLNWIA